jgi:hypothetical protein
MAMRPMQWFRKNAKPIFVVLGVVCMFSFVIAPYLIDLSQQEGRGQKDPIALTWTKGTVRENELVIQRMRHNAVQSFLIAVIGETMQRGGRPIVNGQQISDERMFSQVGTGLDMDSSDPALVITMLMAEEAKRLGIAVDRAAAKEYLNQLSRPELAEGDWAELMDGVLKDFQGQLSADDVLDHLAYELRAQHARRLASAGLESLPPGKIWDYFNRLNRQVTIEAFPIDVKPFIDQVKGEPTSAEVDKLFQEGRFRDPNPNIPEPGFRKPHKIAFEWVRVDFQPFLEEAKQKVTEEEIKKQYDLDISQGKHKELDLPPATPPGETPATPPGQTPATPAAPGDEKKDGDKPAAPPAAGAPKADAPKTDVPKTDAPKADADKPADPPAPECQETNQPPEKTADAKAQDKPAEKSADEKADAAKPDETKPDQTKPDADKPDKPDQPPPPKEPKFKPLDAVRDGIREQLARPIAQEAQTKAIDELTKVIDNYGAQYSKYLARKGMKGKVNVAKSDPGKFDLAAAVAKYKFVIGKMPLSSRFEASQTEIGKKVSEFDISGGRLQMLQFADIAFAQDQRLYDVQKANSVDPDTTYLYYRTAQEQGGEVTLAEARPQVVAAWKKQKAFELALEEAKRKLADPKAKSATSLREIVAADAAKLITPGPFSWLTSGAVPFGFGAPELSRVDGIDLAGREFMQAVYALEPGQTGIAPNQAHGTVYLVRLVSQQPEERLLRDQFMERGVTMEVMLVHRDDMMQTFGEWFRGLEERYQVKWNRPPINLQERG